MILTKERETSSGKDPSFARAQVNAWEKTLAVRISMQQILDQVNAFPVLPISDGDVPELKDNELHNLLSKTLNELVDVLAMQCNQPSERKRSRRSIQSSNDWQQVLEPQLQLQPHWESVVNKWHARTHFGSEEKKSTMRVFNQTIWDQIDQKLADTNKVMEKSCMPLHDSKRRRLRSDVWGVSDGDSDSEGEGPREGFDEEVHDDRQFYSFLLKTFIASSTGSSGEAGTAGMRAEDLAALRSYKRSKSKVDRKASKGRKIKYVAHEKLANFMFPLPGSRVEDSSFDTDRLYTSLFQ